MLDLKIILVVELLLIGAAFCDDATSANSTTTQGQSRIVGGVTTTIAQVPYLVNLRINGQFKCGGTMVASSYIVTAAHCVSGVAASSLTIHGGSSTLSPSGVGRAVSRVTVHPNYSASTFANDIAVLKLASPLTGTNISPVQLCNSSLTAGVKLKVSGWGLTTENGSSASNVVRTVTVPIINRARCKRVYQGTVSVTGSMVCAGVLGSKDSCSGDSGGPAIHNNRLCGVVSFGIGCARPTYPGVYTNVNSFRNFIKNAMAN